MGGSEGLPVGSILHSGAHSCCLRFLFGDELQPEWLPFLSSRFRHSLQCFLAGKLARAFGRLVCHGWMIWFNSTGVAFARIALNSDSKYPTTRVSRDQNTSPFCCASCKPKPNMTSLFPSGCLNTVKLTDG